MKLTGRRALVTGAGTDGIGRACARALAAAGAQIALHHLDQADQAAATAREITALGTRAIVLQGDFGTPEAARRVVREAEAGLGGIDILICAAALLLRKPAMETDDRDWARVHAVNLQAYFATAQEAARGMVARGWGRIIMISSVKQWTPGAGLIAYASAKAGVMQLGRSLALELAPTGVTVNLIAPGTIETDFNRTALADPGYRRQKMDLIPMGRIGRPDDVAVAAVFLASEEASYITGANLTVDGGLELRP